ncbi:hypothetical protein PARPLA_01162 [Rhodobacteraceae bacterium THAF1]|uniref:hypothetical protein n=1 Tax=Palleronia sp. THAF1 TaxID=2587842 RepID=UPI000F3F6DFD|nr:hypothetical protein [Palleronia sp. THAF1]QFU07315.1 hypothetical protein FIU81_01370 [Palleronia sp. THAF1]VDC20773.1 hypothetical protein PARPLA_01162 [Rhodobacteraceae bacterium THAF1]
MTALTEYERLEASGLWRPNAYQQRRNVIVSMGDATLSISGTDEMPLAHWSLPAIERRNPGETPAIFAPGADAREELELDDDLMIAAIERVHTATMRARPRPGRLRSVMLTGALLALLLFSVVWLPGVLVNHASVMVPPAVRADTGARLLRHLTRLSGDACASPAARAPLTDLARRLIGSGSGRIVVLPDAGSTAFALPGQTIIVDRRLIEDHDGPGPIAGHILAAQERAAQVDPIRRVLAASGPTAAIRLMTSGEIPEDDLRSYAERLLATTPEPVATDALIARFAEADVSSAAYAYALDLTGETVLPLIEGDPVSDDAPEILTDGQWVALQQICE